MFHTYLTILIPSLVTFVSTIIFTYFMISYMKRAGITATDHNKKGNPTVAGSGGIAVALGFSVGLFTYIFGSRFPSPTDPFYIPVAKIAILFAVILSVVLISIVGFLDDINVKKEAVKTTDMMDTREGLKQWQKPVLTFIGAVPLVAINAGIKTVSIPFIGLVNFGLFYPLLILPLAIVFAANAFNLLGGFDGIATGTGLIASLGLLIYSIAFGNYTGVLISSVLFSSLLVMFAFNVYPSKIIPGDSYTYLVGAALASDMIVGGMEGFGIIIFMPWIIEFILHARKKFKVTDLGIIQKDYTFKPPYGRKIYSWTHLIMNLKRCNEKQVSMYMWIIEALFVILGLGLKLISIKGL